MKNYLGILGLMLVTIIWGGGFIASDVALQTLGPFSILTGRFLIAAILMLPLFIKNIRSIRKEEIRAGLILGIVLFTAFSFQITALQYTTPSKNAFLTATNVVFVPFFAYLFCKKKVPLQGIIGALLALTGAGLLALNSNFSLGLGDGLTMLCAVGFALQIFLTGEFVAKYRVGNLMFFQMLMASVCAGLAMLVSGESSELVFETSGILCLLFLGVAATGLTFFLQTFSQQYVDESKTAIILSMESVFGTIFSVWLLDEAITLRMVLGCVVIFSAVLIAEVRFKPAKSMIHKEKQKADCASPS